MSAEKGTRPLGYYVPLLSHTHKQRAGLDVEHLGLERGRLTDIPQCGPEKSVLLLERLEPSVS